MPLPHTAHSNTLSYGGATFVSNKYIVVFRNAYVSFGGLLMSLQGPVKKLTPLRVDNVYLLIKK